MRVLVWEVRSLVWEVRGLVWAEEEVTDEGIRKFRRWCAGQAGWFSGRERGREVIVEWRLAAGVGGRCRWSGGVDCQEGDGRNDW